MFQPDAEQAGAEIRVTFELVPHPQDLIRSFRVMFGSQAAVTMVIHEDRRDHLELIQLAVTVPPTPAEGPTSVSASLQAIDHKGRIIDAAALGPFTFVRGESILP